MDRTNDAALLLGRLLMAALFVPGGFSKLTAFSAFAASLAAKGLPYPEIWAALAVAAELGGGLAVLLGFQTRWAALLLIAFTVMASGTSHRFWEYADPERRGQSIQFWKNAAIMGGFLFLYASGPGAWSLDAWRRRAGRASSIRYGDSEARFGG
jgi:putative oxidoreductase